MIFLGLAILGSGYLLVQSLKRGPVAGCGEGSPCNSVLQSRWAYFVPGVPVTAPAVLTYAGLLVALIFRPRTKAWDFLLLGGAMMVIGAALWFGGLQMFALKAFCKWCIGTHLMGLLGAVFILFVLRPLHRKQTLTGAAAAGAGLSLLVACQFFLPQNTTVQTLLGAAATSKTGQVVTIAGLKLDLDELPYRGNPDSGKRVMLMFDYACLNCRRMHQYLTRAEAVFGNDKYLLVMLPTPLSDECNRYVTRGTSGHRDGCLFASMALAMWRADKEKFYQFDRWLIEAGSASSPPTAELARTKAEELLGGRDALTAALADPRTRAGIDKLTAIWDLLKSKTGHATMPKMLLEGSLSEGAPASEAALLGILEKKLGIAPRH
jgi:uncharacterized membrane protein/protein-disulfide isomerase